MMRAEFISMPRMTALGTGSIAGSRFAERMQFHGERGSPDARR